MSTTPTTVTIRFSPSDMELVQEYMSRDQVKFTWTRNLFELSPEVAIYVAAISYIKQYLKDNPQQPGSSE